MLTSAIASCGANNGDPSGVVKSCPAFTSDVENFAQVCPRQPSLINEPTTGTISKLPGCITITDGPEEATEADIECKSSVDQPSINQAVAGAYDSRDVAALPATGLTSSGAASTSSNTNLAASAAIKRFTVVIRSNTSQASGPSELTIGAPLSPTNSTDGPSTAVQSTATSAQASVVNMANGYVTGGCYKEPANGHRALKGSHYTDATSMTVDSCTAYCEKKGFPIAGVEDAQECYCGAINRGLKTNASFCDMPCKGDITELCGGRAVLDIYMSG